MNFFFSDLDNTLIYSHKHKIEEEKTVIEYLDGREQSYISKRTLDHLKKFCSNNENLFIPVTTRSIKQYRRLEAFQTALGFKYAIVCNGAFLLENGVNDVKWENDSFEMCRSCIYILGEVYKLLKALFGESHLHYIEPYLLYIKIAENNAIIEKLKSNYSNEDIDIIYSSGKLFFVPKRLTKGNAIERFINRYSDDHGAVNMFSAGDSEFDISMFEKCNRSFFINTETDPAVTNKTLFSDRICIELESALRNDDYSMREGEVLSL